MNQTTPTENKGLASAGPFLLAGVVCLSIQGLLFGAVITALERNLLRWR